MLDEAVIMADSLSLPACTTGMLSAIVERVSDVPHFWKERNVRAQVARLATKGFTFGQIRGLVTAGTNHLKQSDPNSTHIRSW